MINLIETHYKNFVSKTFKNKDSVKSFLLNHERRKAMFDNLERELKKSEYIIFKSTSKTQEERRKQVQSLVEDFSRLFCIKALEEKEKQIKGVSIGNESKVPIPRIITP